MYISDICSSSAHSRTPDAGPVIAFGYDAVYFSSGGGTIHFTGFDNSAENFIALSRSASGYSVYINGQQTSGAHIAPSLSREKYAFAVV